MTLTRYPFDGEMLTVREIHARVPAINIETLRGYLKRGMTTKQEVLTFNPVAARVAAGKKGRAASNLTNTIHAEANQRRKK